MSRAPSPSSFFPDSPPTCDVTRRQVGGLLDMGAVSPGRRKEAIGPSHGASL
jgi:hypothetical protein